MYDEFLQGLQLLPLKKLIIHVHGLDDEHPGITEASWALFRLKNPNVELHLNLVIIILIYFYILNFLIFFFLIHRFMHMRLLTYCIVIYFAQVCH